MIDTCYVNALGCPKSQSSLHPTLSTPPFPLFPFFPELSVLVATLRFYLSARHFVCLFAFALFLLYAVSLFILWQPFHVSLPLFSFFFRRALLPGKYALIKCVSLYPLSVCISLFLSPLAAGIDSLPILMKCRQLKCLPTCQPPLPPASLLSSL